MTKSQGKLTSVHGTGILPVAETNAVMVGSSSKVDDETEQDQASNQQH